MTLVLFGCFFAFLFLGVPVAFSTGLAALVVVLIEPAVQELELSELPTSHMQGPHFLNVLRVLDVPQALAMAAETKQVRLLQDPNGFEFATKTAATQGWPKDRLRFHSW